ncbi:hypothetical protein GO685_03035 [Wolbachia endosymbiont of Madathamugadia hiepei]|uniref:hypothetical protein n=1 Tax=Wolbachia endosymbiont of Madathamugadia hiepei TaxID=1241303 RepID=UPI00158AB55C|nr:hypothetical protein [Wolbachia endosymbiont of Madathamugadia hiepei]NUX01466.1 hypothetical protein [Wolbachia endosymbiont of Madathamugadia hiepei]
MTVFLTFCRPPSSSSSVHEGKKHTQILLPLHALLNQNNTEEEVVRQKKKKNAYQCNEREITCKKINEHVEGASESTEQCVHAGEWMDLV